ncbi:MAG: aldehyde ferredoxin oxidoreductase [Deltaproteobacteria bacterium]|nr:aldehyde ferredoxin oxidoreductase [Deltaproteobacteria bacterium]
MHSAHGRFLDVDLSTRRLTSRELPAERWEKFVGGSGLACAMLLDEGDPSRVDVLGPDNTLVFMAGLFTGTGVPSACKINVCARSPLTNGWGEAAGSGEFGTCLRASGFDGVVVRGRSEKPVYLLVTDERQEICDAGDLWGRDTFETHAELTARHGDKGSVAAIGPAGESLVRYASVMLDGPVARACGRTGMGAVMGSKRLKAICAAGRQRLTMADKAAYKAGVAGDLATMRQYAKGLHDWSTAGGVEAVEFFGDLPINNWRLGSYREGAKKLAAQSYHPKWLVKHHTCAACPIRCGKILRVEGQPMDGLYGHGPEYETTAGFGSNLLIDEPLYVIHANTLCNRLGVDTMSTASCVAFAFECFERGIIGQADLDGLVLRFGDGAAMIELVRRIALREGSLPTLLGEGSRRAAASIGRGSDAFTIEVKGLEVAFHDPRAHVSMAANYATAARGGDHLDALTYFLARGTQVADFGFDGALEDLKSTPEKGDVVYKMQNFLGLHNSLGICKFLYIGRIGPSVLARWVSQVAGFPVDMEGVLRMGERLVQLKRLYNVRCGVRSKDDRLPKRLQTEPRPDGRSGGVLPDTPLMVDRLYELRGWAADGIPTRATVERFGLEAYDVARPQPTAGQAPTPSVTLVLHANLSRYAGDRERVELPFRPGATIADYVHDVGIPAHEYYAVVHRGEVTRDFNEVPATGAVVELLPLVSGG